MPDYIGTGPTPPCFSRVGEEQIAHKQRKVSEVRPKDSMSLPVVPGIPYKFEKGGIYLIEVKDTGIDLATIKRFTDYFRDYYDIHLHFVLTRGKGFSLQPVPAVKADTAGSGLVATDRSSQVESSESAKSAPVGSGGEETHE